MAIAESLKSPFFQNTRPTESPQIKSFEEVYKTAYSHGLESIYAIETIDLKSVKRIEQARVEAPAPKKRAPVFDTAIDQLEFDFGDQYRGWMGSFVVREPIQVLGLSKHTEKCLLANQRFVLRDLIGVDLNTFVFFKGMGQGHIEEIRERLKQYLAGRKLKKSRTVDMSAWVRSWVGAADRKKAWACCLQHNLEALFPLSHSESIEVGRTTPEIQQGWAEEIQTIIRKDAAKQTISTDLKRIVDVFIRPWMRRRLGFATQQELIERLQKVSEDPQITENVLNFLGTLFFKETFPLAPCLYQVHERLYCSDEHVAKDFALVVKTASTYFYKSDICYNLPHLVQLITRELACCWQGFADGFVEKALRQSSHFHVSKRGSDLMIQLAI